MCLSSFGGDFFENLADAIALEWQMSISGCHCSKCLVFSSTLSQYQSDFRSLAFFFSKAQTPVIQKAVNAIHRDKSMLISDLSSDQC